MKVEKRNLTLLNEIEDNVRLHPEAQIRELARSVEAFGQVRPILVDENNTILAGNGLYRALLKLGWKEADVYVLEGLSERDKKRLMVADNKIYELGLMDNGKLLEVLKDIKKEDVFDIPGFDEEILKGFFAEIEEAGDTIRTYGNISDEEVKDFNTRTESTEGRDWNHEYEVAISNEDIELDDKKRPYIICPKCKEKIWL